MKGKLKNHKNKGIRPIVGDKKNKNSLGSSSRDKPNIKIWWCFKKYAEKNNMAFDKIEV